MSRLFGGRAAEHRFALVFFARDAHRAGVDIPPGISALLNDLTAAISDTGSAEVGRESIDGMRTWGTPEETGRQVGLTGRRVRMLCAEGLVAHRLTGGGHYLVDLEDLQRHLRQAA